MAELAPSAPTIGPSEAEVEALYRRYAPVLHARARSILGNDEAAADAVLGYCADGDSGRGGDTGYDSIRARQRILRASGKP